MTSSRDVRDLLGMRSHAAKAMGVGFALTCAVMAIYGTTDVRAEWPLWVAATICAVSAFVLIISDGDPMPLWQAIPMATVGAVSCGIVMSVLPVPVENPMQLWTFGMSTAVLTFMCVRGRTLLAWVGLILMIGTSMAWGALTGQGAGYGLSYSIINAAPVLMATFFAYTIRPQAKAIYEMREESTRRIAAESAEAAALEERDAQLDRLDELARPLLERIAAGAPLGDDDKLACELLEARLRDSLRAPGLTQGSIVDAVQAARSRGVDVVLLDDHGMNAAEPVVRARLQAAVVAELQALSEGAITIRILPPQRTLMATILISVGETTRRLEFGHNGRVRDTELVR